MFRPLHTRQIARYGRVATLYLISLSIFAFAVAFPETLMNFYLQAMGFDRAFIGLFHSASQLGGLVLALPSILVFDRIGRGAALVFGIAFAMGVRTLTVLTPSPQLIVAAEAASGFGTVMFGLASVSLLADASTNDNRASLFAFSDFARIVALLLGSLTAGVLPGLIAPVLQAEAMSAEAYRAALLGAFSIRILGIIPLVLIARDMNASQSSGQVAQPDEADQTDPTRVLPTVRALPLFNPRAVLNVLRQRPQTFVFAAPLALILLAETLVFAFFNLLMRDWFGASDALIGVIVGLNALIGSAIALLAPPLAQRLGYRPTIVWGTLASAACIASIALTRSLLVGVLVIFVQVAASQIARVLYRAHVINVSPRDDYFIVSIVMALAVNVGLAVAPPISGLIQQTYGYTPLFVASTALLIGAAILFEGTARFVDARSSQVERSSKTSEIWVAKKNSLD